VRASDIDAVCVGDVRYSPTKSIWTLGMLAGAVVGGWLTITWSAALLFVISTIVVLLFAAVQGRNVRMASLLTMGECWHNNHHAFPGSARLGLAPGEWDPGWWVLSGLKRLGLVWGIRLPADLPVRPEVVTACHDTVREVNVTAI
jgi:fatty-acid desaturase